MAVVKAAKEVFPNAKIQGCNFHLAKNVVKNLGQHGLKSRYQTDIKFAAEIRQLLAIAFVPVGMVLETWNRFINKSEKLNPKEQKKDVNIDKFINDYFVAHYIGKLKTNGTRGKPQFAVELWNVHDSAVKGKSLNFLNILNIRRCKKFCDQIWA